MQADSPTLAPARPLREIADLPGPRGLPVLGNLLQVKRSAIHQDVERWSREHGPYFRFSLGGRRLLAVADHEALHAVLRDRPRAFDAPACSKPSAPRWA